LAAPRPAFGPEFAVETEFDRTRIDDYQFGITRAVRRDRGKQGQSFLSDASTSRRLGALAPWVHIAVLRREEVLRMWHRRWPARRRSEDDLGDRSVEDS